MLVVKQMPDNMCNKFLLAVFGYNELPMMVVAHPCPIIYPALSMLGLGAVRFL